MNTSGETLFLGRQPILNRRREIVGSEILFRPVVGRKMETGVSFVATADVVCNAFAELGLANALGTQRAFVQVDWAFLTSDLILLLPVHTVVLVISPGELAENSLERCRELRAAGYEFALAKVDSLNAAPPEYIQLASYVCVQIDAEPELNLVPQWVVRKRNGAAIQLLALGVDTPKQQARAELLGFDCFQGYAFAKPVLISGRKLDATTQALIRLLNLLRQDAEITDIEPILKKEPGLVANLLRLSNSAAVAAPVRVTSIRQAVTLLGRQQLQRWLNLLLFSSQDNTSGMSGNPLMQQAALRGFLLESLALRCMPARSEIRDPAFITGVMSAMPAALEIPMEEILAQINVAEEVHVALSSHDNLLGQLLLLIEDHEAGDAQSLAGRIHEMDNGLTLALFNLCWSEAMAWARRLNQ